MSPPELPDGVYTEIGQDGAVTEIGQDGALAPIAEVSQQATPQTPIALIVITLDYCSRTFGVAPCTATGTKCFNTWPTCKALAAYLKTTKDYKFTSRAAPDIPFDGVRPYVEGIQRLPTEIKTNLTVAGRLVVTMGDEPDGDVGIDPYVRDRSYFPNIPGGTFWKKFLRRNLNYKGRALKFYEGWWGETEGQYDLRWVGKLEAIMIKGNQVKIEAVDYLKDLSKVDIPPKLDVKLLANITDTATSFTITGNDKASIDTPTGWIKIGDEIMSYTGYNTTTGELTGASRGQKGTDAATHSANDKVQKCRYFSPTNGFDRMKDMILTDGSVPTANVDTTAFDTAKAFDGNEPNVSAFIWEPTKLDKLLFELGDLFDSKIWVAENQKITIARNIPNDPARSRTAFSDADNILHKSASFDQNEKARLTRCYLYWEPNVLGEMDKPSGYDRLDVAIDADWESANGGNEVIEKKIYCRWLTTSGQVEETVRQFAANCAMRQVWRNREANPLVTVDAALKDEGIKTGDWLLLSTDELLDIYGFSVASVEFQVVKREHKGDKITLLLLRNGAEQVGYIGADSLPDWASATADDKRYGYICDDDGKLPTDQPGYFIW